MDHCFFATLFSIQQVPSERSYQRSQAAQELANRLGGAFPTARQDTGGGGVFTKKPKLKVPSAEEAKRIAKIFGSKYSVPLWKLWMMFSYWHTDNPRSSFLARFVLGIYACMNGMRLMCWNCHSFPEASIHRQWWGWGGGHKLCVEIDILANFAMMVNDNKRTKNKVS